MYRKAFKKTTWKYPGGPDCRFALRSFVLYMTALTDYQAGVMCMVQWRRNLYVIFFVQVLSLSGFSIVVPFLPLYLKELDVVTGGSAAFWSGMVFSSQAVAMMISAPFWGAAADRYGRKLMLVRASLGGAVLLAAMGFVSNAEQLTLLRLLQGFVSGTIPAANALVAATTPKEHTGEALGMVQMGAWVGVAIGPLIGGIIGDTLGFRESFWVTGALLAMAGIAAMFWVHEDFRPVAKANRPKMMEGFRIVLRIPNMFGLYSEAFLQSFGRTLIFPIAALFVAELMGNRPGVATVTGLVLGVRAVTGSLSTVWLGRLSDRIGHARVLFVSFAAVVLAYLPQPFVSSAWQLVLLQGLTGFAEGGILPAIGALMNLRIPPGSQGATYGLNSSVNSAGRCLAPMLGAVFAIWFGLRSVFGVAAAAYGVAAFVAWRIKRSARAEV
ncbi:MAG: MFS transporter [Desulfobacteraceae bacterium]|nr:MAG: MFS transporter [Desulfobacteraceae bacterium]